jgi:ABC-type multidrug transport system ATPase subunit
MNRGKLVASGPIEQVLNSRHGVVYSLSLKGAADGLARRLAGLPWVTHTSMTSSSGASLWQVSVSDEAAAEQDLLRCVMADPAVTVTGFNRKKYELEEVFMEIVKGDVHVG